jgi:predicted Zn-dependent protease
MTIFKSKMKSGRRYALRALGGVGAATLLMAAPLQQARARNILMPSVQDQKKLGADAAKDVEKQYKTVGGAKLQRVEKVGRKLVAALNKKDRTTWDYRFRVLNSKDINAFALPGGNMYIFTGLLDRLQNDNELAAVMAHEITHVRQEHWAKAATASQMRSLGLLAILGVTKADKGWYNAAGVVNSLVDLRYSRADEDEADRGGLNNMVAAHYNPQGMLQLFQVLNSAGGEGNTPTFLRDHPLTQDRIRKTQERIAALKK